MEIRRSDERGHVRSDWLDSRHTFSFGGYYDPRHMGFSDLRVINEDRIEPGQGFGTHPHRDMEILTWVLDGVLEHRDSMGNHGLIRAGEIQRMSAGTGVTHSEWNASEHEPVHLLQIWILPEREGLAPGYEQRRVVLEPGQGFQRVAAREPGAGAVRIHQDATLRVARLAPGERAATEVAPERSGWLQVARGGVSVEGAALCAGDGAPLRGPQKLELQAGAGGAELLLFELR
jgi:redox-sensitive bicupin YhaK (pirin superfamily)